MLTGLKVSPSACKCVFHRPEHNANGGLGLEMLQRIELKE